MFKIGEFSRLSRVSIRMLRYYDEKGLLSPALVDPFTGYRHYTAAQISELQKIVFLRDVGFGVREIGELLEQWDPAFILKRLSQKKREWEAELLRQTEVIHKIGRAMEDLERASLRVHCNLCIRALPPVTVAGVRRVIKRYDCEQELWYALYEQMERAGLQAPPGAEGCAVFYDEEHKDENVDVEVCVEISDTAAMQGDEPRIHTLEALPYAASVMVQGPFDRIGGAFQDAAQWLEEHSGWYMNGPVRQICHVGPQNASRPEEYLTEILIPVEPEGGKLPLDSPTV